MCSLNLQTNDSYLLIKEELFQLKQLTYLLNLLLLITKISNKKSILNLIIYNSKIYPTSENTLLFFKFGVRQKICHF